MLKTAVTKAGIDMSSIPDTMKAIAKTEAGPGAKLITAPVPKIGPRDVLVKVNATAVCGTDLHIYTWDAWSQGRVKPPLTIGHEFGGTVVAVGDEVLDVSLGDYVSAETHVVCGTCYQCRTGAKHICSNTQILGVDIPGCYAEYVAIPAKNAWKNADTLPLEWAPLQEPLGNAVHTVLAGDVAGRTVVISGCGPIGIMAAGVAKACGASAVIAIDINSYRLDLAGKMGATHLIKADEQDAVAAVLAAVPGGVDVVCEMSGNAKAMRDGFKMIRNGGRYSILGIPAQDVPLDIAEIVFKGVTIQGITGRKMYETWYQVANLLNSRQLDLTPMITHRKPLEDVEAAMDLMKAGLCGKVVLTP
jgi:threonine 3-dehydrogenase